MRGINENTGQSLDGIDHLKQSVRDILTTPIGSRVMRREYGCRLFSLIDNPSTRSTIVSVYAAVYEAISLWEPRLELEQITAASISPGKLTLDLRGRYLPNGREITLAGIVVS